MCQWCQRSSIADGLTAGAFPPAPNAGNPAADPPAGGSARSTADVIFRNGTIRTMARRETVEALAIARRERAGLTTAQPERERP